MTRVGTIPQLQKLLAQAQTASIVESLLFREKSRTHTRKKSVDPYTFAHFLCEDVGASAANVHWMVKRCPRPWCEVDFGRPEFGEVPIM
jgi:hypothetical protein